MISAVLLALTTCLYAGYNLFIKVSGSHVPVSATSSIAATICLQIAALTTSLVFAASLLVQGGHSFQLTNKAYVWAVLAGLCIGGAEIAYLYLFSGIGGRRPMAASVAIPVVVCGTVVLAGVFSLIFLRETLSLTQIFGGTLSIVGIVLFFVGG